MIQGKWLPQGSDLTQVLAIRQNVFGRGRDELDDESWNVLVFQDDAPAASGRLWWKDGAFRLGEVGVLPAFRNQRLGDLVLRLLLFKAQSHFAREVRLVCSDEVSGFFARLGFRPDPSVPADGAGMEMLLPGDEINLDSCASCKKENCPSRV